MLEALAWAVVYVVAVIGVLTVVAAFAYIFAFLGSMVAGMFYIPIHSINEHRHHNHPHPA
jgi:uncharacterized protein involved in cysteine biosynthesis